MAIRFGSRLSVRIAAAALLGGLGCAQEVSEPVAAPSVPTGRADGTATFRVEGAPAQSIYDAFDVEGRHDGGYHTTKEADGLLSCVVNSPFRGTPSYECSMGSVLQIAGAGAGALFDGMQAEPSHDGGYRLTKEQEGNLSCTLRIPSGPGAQLFYACAFTWTAEPAPVDDGPGTFDGNVWNASHSDILELVGLDVSSARFREIAEKYQFAASAYGYYGANLDIPAGWGVRGIDGEGNHFWFNYRLDGGKNTVCRLDWILSKPFAQLGTLDENFGYTDTNLPFGVQVEEKFGPSKERLRAAGLIDRGPSPDWKNNHRFEIPGGYHRIKYVLLHSQWSSGEDDDNLSSLYLTQRGDEFCD